MRPVITLFTRWWEKVPDPRVVNMIFGIGYLAFLGGGVSTLINPPRSIIGVVGDTVMLLVGLFFLIGSIIGIFAGSRDFWQLERVGIATMGAGLTAYGYIVTVLHLTEQGSRLTQLSVIVVALCFLGLRMAMIWRYDYKPRG